MAKRPQRHADLSRSVTQLSIGEYLIRRLGDYSIRHVFGVPGDYVLGFYAMLEQSPLELVNCTREDCAGYATDAYARIHGMGALCVTYGVGGLSVVNSTAGAWAEKSPVVVISGAPGLNERSERPLLHHCVREWSTQLEVFEHVTAACAEIRDPETAFREIDRVLDVCFRTKRPVYIELPRDLVDVVPDSIRPYAAPPRVSDPAALAEAVREAVDRIEQAKAPVIIAGVELQRFGLQADTIALAEAAGIAVASTLLGKSVVSEVHPLYIGLYEGGMGRREVTEFVESSDCRILLGTILTDIDLGIFTANLDPRRTIHATSEDLRISHHHFQGVLLEDFIRELALAKPKAARCARPEATIVTLVGDGAFQMTGMELSTLVGRGLSATIIILDNAGYGTERVILDGPFNDINPWRYEKLPEVLGGGTGYEARTEGEFDRALTAALADNGGISVIRAHLARDDFSTTVRRLGESLSERLRD